METPSNQIRKEQIRSDRNRFRLDGNILDENKFVGNRSDKMEIY